MNQCRHTQCEVPNVEYTRYCLTPIMNTTSCNLVGLEFVLPIKSHRKLWVLYWINIFKNQCVLLSSRSQPVHSIGWGTGMEHTNFLRTEGSNWIKLLHCGGGRLLTPWLFRIPHQCSMRHHSLNPWYTSAQESSYILTGFPRLPTGNSSGTKLVLWNFRFPHCSWP